MAARVVLITGDVRAVIEKLVPQQSRERAAIKALSPPLIRSRPYGIVDRPLHTFPGIFAGMAWKAVP